VDISILVDDPRILEKARHSHRSPAGGFAGFRGGQFLPVAVVAEESARAYQEVPNLLREFSSSFGMLQQLYHQNALLVSEGKTAVPLVPLGAIENQMKAGIRASYLSAMTLGKRAAGDLRATTDEEQAYLKRLRLDEYQFLRGFTGDMRTGGGRMDYGERAEWYVNAVREVFWLGWVLGQKPGSVISWHNGDTAHCRSCDEFASHGPYSLEDFRRDVLDRGYLPQAGALDCRGFHCRCFLTSSDPIPLDEQPGWLEKR